MKQLRALLYARVSSPAQKRRNKAAMDEPSLSQQTQEMRRAAETRGWQIITTPEDVVSGSVPLKERPAGAAIYEAAARDAFDVLVVYDNDRIGRDKDGVVAKVFRADMRSMGKQIFSVHQPVEPKPPAEYQPYEDDAALWMESVSDTASSVYIRQFRRRHAFGMRKRIEEKKLLPGGLSIGYTAERHVLPSGKTFLGERRLDPVYAPVVRRIFDAYAAGDSLRTIAGLLNREGGRTPSGHVWTCTTIRGIIQNPTYYGATAYYRTRSSGRADPRHPGRFCRARQPMDRWLLAEGAHHPAIVTKEQWEHCQRLRQRKHRFGRTHGNSPLLSGLLRCGLCGAAMQRSGNWKGGYYMCSRYSKTGLSECTPNSIRRYWLEDHVIAYLSTLARSPDLLANLQVTQSQARLDHLDAEQQRLEAEIETVQARLEKAREAYEAGADSVQEYAQRKQGLVAQVNALHARLAQTRTEREHLGQRQQAQQSLVELLAEFTERFLSRPLPVQKALLREIIDVIVVKDGEARILFKDGETASSDYERAFVILHLYSDGEQPASPA